MILYFSDEVPLCGSLRECGFFADEHGKPVERTKFSHPYSYDGFVLWRGGCNEDANNTVYSDRLLRWDREKHDELCTKHFGNKGQHWEHRKPKKIEAFLRDWTDCPDLKLILVMEYCNQSNGYPCWRFDFYTPVTSEEK